MAANEELRSASSKGDAGAVESALGRRADPNSCDRSGWTALHGAAGHGRAVVIPLLLAARADPNAKDVFGRTPLDWAIKNKKDEAIAALSRLRVEIGGDNEEPCDQDLTGLPMKKLGVGNFGIVYSCKIQGRLLAVKTFKPEQEKLRFRELLEQELALWRLIPNHQHVARLLSVGTLNGEKCLVMPLYQGGSLKQMLDDLKAFDCQLTLKKIVMILGEIADGVAHLHANKVVHRDLAARNILFADKCRKTAIVSDFGLARELGVKDYYKMVNREEVAWKWMAPESLAEHKFTAASDTWSFGVLMWEVFTLGQSPYPDVFSAAELVVKLVMKKISLLWSAPKSVDPRLLAMAQKCLENDPSRRLTMVEIREQLQQIASQDRDLSPLQGAPDFVSYDGAPDFVSYESLDFGLDG